MCVDTTAAAPAPSGGVFTFAGVLGEGSSVGPELVGALKALIDKLGTPNQVGLYIDVFFCKVSPLGSHV